MLQRKFSLIFRMHEGFKIEVYLDEEFCIHFHHSERETFRTECRGLLTLSQLYVLKPLTSSALVGKHAILSVEEQIASSHIRRTPFKWLVSYISQYGPGGCTCLSLENPLSLLATSGLYSIHDRFAR